MSDLTFALLDETGLSILRSWYSDPELQRRLEYPTQTWFDYVSGEPNVHAWMIQEDDLSVGHLQLDVGADQTGYIGFCVKPELRNQGYGKRILRAFLARSEVRTLNRIVAEAEVDNSASHSCLKAAGFAQEGNGPDEYGFLRFIYTTANTAGR